MKLYISGNFRMPCINSKFSFPNVAQTAAGAELHQLHLFSVVRLSHRVFQSTGVAEYTDCISAEG